MNNGDNSNSLELVSERYTIDGGGRIRKYISLFGVDTFVFVDTIVGGEMLVLTNDEEILVLIINE